MPRVAIEGPHQRGLEVPAWRDGRLVAEAPAASVNVLMALVLLAVFGFGKKKAAVA